MGLKHNARILWEVYVKRPDRRSLLGATWGNAVDTSHYSVRRYDSVTNSYIYAPWDWNKTKTMFGLNVAKASEGLYPDPRYRDQVATMKTAGARFASYHFFRPELNPIQQAQAFLTVMDPQSALIMIDCETRPGTLSYSTYMTNLGSFSYELSKSSALPQVVYSRASFWNEIWIGAGRPAWTSKLLQCIAQYPLALQTSASLNAILNEGYIPPFPTPMLGLGPIIGWQYTASIPNSMIPGHNMVKAVEDGNLWAGVLPSPTPEPEPLPASLRFTVLTPTLNIRSSPSTASSIVGQLSQNDIVSALDVGGTDCWIKTDRGWVAVFTGGKLYMKLVA